MISEGAETVGNLAVDGAFFVCRASYKGGDAYVKEGPHRCICYYLKGGHWS